MWKQCCLRGLCGDGGQEEDGGRSLIRRKQPSRRLRVGLNVLIFR